MNVVAEKKHIHQGENVKLARGLRGLSQEELSFRLGIDQSKYSRTVEQKDTIDDELLNRIAAELEVNVDFLKSFELEKAATYNIINSESVSLAENAIGQIGHVGEQNYYYPIEQIMQTTSEILKIQKEHYEKEIVSLKELNAKDIEIALLRKENEELKSTK